MLGFCYQFDLFFIFSWLLHSEIKKAKNTAIQLFSERNKREKCSMGNILFILNSSQQACNEKDRKMVEGVIYLCEVEQLVGD